MFLAGFGMTEVGVTHLNTREHFKYKSVGRLLPYIQMQVTFEDWL